MQRPSILSLVSLCTLFSGVFSHSWVSCTDYRIQSDAQAKLYSNDQCKGFGRSWAQCCENTEFGLDRGYNYQPGNSGKLCRDRLSTGNNYNAAYSSTSPMAKYAPGQKVCLAWAPKNHVAASCNNPFIPDNGMEVYMSRANPTADATSLDQMRKIADWGKNPGSNAFKAFQNCPNFCSNPDKATCTGCFYIPQNVQVGAVYSFIWTWEFNALSDQYTTCWEALIVPNTLAPTVNLPATYTNIAASPGGSTNVLPPATSAPAVPTSAVRATSQTVATSAVAASSQAPTQTTPTQGTNSTTSANFTSATTMSTTVSPTPMPCTYRWQCQQFSRDYNFADCVNGFCECVRSFAGSATVNDVCRCDKVGIYWGGPLPVCLAQSQCIADYTGPGCRGRCSNIINGVGSC